MIESIQFSEGMLSFTVRSARSSPACQCKSRIQFDFSEGCTVSELHSSKFMNFVYSVYPEGANEVCNMILELLRTQTGIRWIYLDCLDRPSESLEGSAATDEQIKLARGTV